MTPEIIAIVAVGVAIAGVILTSARGVRQDISELRGEVNELRGEVGTLRERMTRLEVLMEGLRSGPSGDSPARYGSEGDYGRPA